MASDNQSKEKKSFRASLNLPQTEFPIRPDAHAADPVMVARWEEEDLYEKTFYAHKGSEKFVLHDGPPYANGNIHLGGAYNKILKDVVGKSQRMMGRQVPITPGWDCHGLPIELKVTAEQPGLDRDQIQKACRAYANKWVEIQKEQFKRLGVLMNWDHPYLTMNFEYEAWTVRAFGEFFSKGYIERSNKTVPWCPSCQTVLASAEIEYQERKDPSVYVAFPLTEPVKQALFPEYGDTPVNLLVWTTTPWTLPLNRAVLLKPNTDYVLVELNGSRVIVGRERAQALCDELGQQLNILKTISSDALAATVQGQPAQVHHPFIEEYTVPILLDDSVLLTDGTAVVHCAPGAGPEDYAVGIKNKLEIYSPVGPDGRYTSQVQPEALSGVSITDGQGWVLKRLLERGRLVHKTSLRHSFPHCWRCRGPLLFRATKQWFCNLEKDNLQGKTVAAIRDAVTAIPEKSANRLVATLEGRLEWCLSRQRVWGTPIPALICTSCDTSYTSREFIDAVAQGISQEGIEYWNHVPIETLLPRGVSCSGCHGRSFKKEQDILDVWFDSGISHYAVLERYEELRFPADMYVEGKDQHRGWFQSSLLTSMVLEGSPCTKQIMTHGFVVDAKGHKMSKSLGNVVLPEQMLEKLGTDGLRLWVASIDVGADPLVSDVLIRNVQEVYRKVRNTCRFLLSNLYDFDITTDAVPLNKLHTIDQFALRDLYLFQQDMLHAYEQYDLTQIFHLLGDYCAAELSSFYLDIIKDRLYVSQATGRERRSAQTACWHILDSLTRLIAPVLSFAAEQISDLYQKDKTESIHLQRFASQKQIENELMQFVAQAVGRDPQTPALLRTHRAIERVGLRAWFVERWELIRALRSAFLKALEGLREAGTIKHSLEGHCIVYIKPGTESAQVLNPFFADLKRNEETPEKFFKELLVVSGFEFAEQKANLKELVLPVGKKSYEGIAIGVQPASGQKCPRCWQWSTESDANGLCSRCGKLV